MEAEEDLTLQMEQDPHQLVAEVPVDQELPQDQVQQALLILAAVAAVAAVAPQVKVQQVAQEFLS